MTMTLAVKSVAEKIFVKKYTEEDVLRAMKVKGYEKKSPMFWADVAQYYRFCECCNNYVDVDQISETTCDQCACEE
ncbi:MULTISPECIES: hypothetical protein [Pseudobacillus]|uniref:hypothetical protein n=1 Tax=Pseudobacillus TaxID=108525 RepID=UPI0038794391